MPKKQIEINVLFSLGYMGQLKRGDFILENQVPTAEKKIPYCGVRTFLIDME